MIVPRRKMNCSTAPREKPPAIFPRPVASAELVPIGKHTAFPRDISACTERRNNMLPELEKNYDSLDRIGKWDSETREVVKKRIANELGDAFSYNFLTEREGEILELLTDTLIPQDKNTSYIKIPEIIDRDLEKNIKGVRYGKNPWPREFYQT